MTLLVTIANRNFSGRRGRKLLLPLQITLSGPPAPAPHGLCALRVSVARDPGVPVGTPPFLMQQVPGSWRQDNADTVTGVPDFGLNDPTTMTAFASFLLDESGGPTLSVTQNFLIELIDRGLPPAFPEGVIFSTTFALTVTAQAALNKSVVFVLDRTVSMGTNSNGSGTRLDRLKVAVARGLGLFTDADSIGVVTLDGHNGDVRVPFGQGSSTIPSAESATAALDLDQSFPQGKKYQVGIDLGRAQSSAATVLVVTDGICGSKGYPSSMQSSPTSALFIGESTTLPDPRLINLISSDGAYAVALPNTGEFAIEKLLSQILIDLGGGNVVRDPDGSVGPDEKHSFPLLLNETDRELQLIIFSDEPEWLQVELDPPLLGHRPKHEQQPAYFEVEHDRPKDGWIWDNKPLVSEGLVTQRGRLPALEPDAPFTPKVVVSRSSRAPRHARPTFTFLAAVQSDLLLDAVATASGFEVGADLLLSAQLTEYGLPVQNREGVEIFVELRHPDGGVETVHLRECTPGHFEASRRSFRAGIYTVHFVATGRTLLQKRPFRREALRSLVIFPLGASRCPCISLPEADPCCRT